MVLKAVSIATVLLSSAINNPPYPWFKIEASSEQRTPVYVGARPRAMEVGGYKATHPTINESLLRKAETLAPVVRKALGHESVELEAWPIQDDTGQRTWAFARWRENERAPW